MKHLTSLSMDVSHQCVCMAGGGGDGGGSEEAGGYVLNPLPILMGEMQHMKCELLHCCVPSISI